MFNWLKKLVGSAGDAAASGLVYPPVAAKGQDESVAAPYKVEAPEVKQAPAKTVNPAVSKKPVTKKKSPAKKPSAGTRGRKPKAKPVAK